MSTNFVTEQQVEKWFDDLDSTLKNQVVNTPLSGSKQREELYSLYQAAQLLKARFYQDLKMEVEMPNFEYDPE